VKYFSLIFIPKPTSSLLSLSIMKKIALIFLSVIFVSSTDPLDYEDSSFVLFPDLDAVVERPSSPPSTDWCGEYDRMRFLIDSSTIGINTGERHVELVGATISTVLSFVNNQVVTPPMVRLERNNVHKIAFTMFEIDESRMQRVDHFLTEIRNPDSVIGRVGEGDIRRMFRQIVDQSPRMSKREVYVLLARLVVGLSIIHRESSKSLDGLIAQKKEFIDKINSNKTKIESCLRQLADAARDQLDDTVQKQQRMEEILGRFEPVRNVIVDAIQRESVSPIAGTTSADLKIQCLSSVKFVISNNLGVNRELPKILRKSLHQRGWSFLLTWLQALDDYERTTRNTFAEISAEHEWAITNYKSMVLIAQANLVRLEEQFNDATTAATTGASSAA